MVSLLKDPSFLLFVLLILDPPSQIYQFSSLEGLTNYIPSGVILGNPKIKSTKQNGYEKKYIVKFKNIGYPPKRSNQEELEQEFQ